jgi:hypothetical protein
MFSIIYDYFYLSYQYSYKLIVFFSTYYYELTLLILNINLLRSFKKYYNKNIETYENQITKMKTEFSYFKKEYYNLEKMIGDKEKLYSVLKKRENIIKDLGKENDSLREMNMYSDTRYKNLLYNYNNLLSENKILKKDVSDFEMMFDQMNVDSECEIYNLQNRNKKIEKYNEVLQKENQERKIENLKLRKKK